VEVNTSRSYHNINSNVYDGVSGGWSIPWLKTWGYKSQELGTKLVGNNIRLPSSFLYPNQGLDGLHILVVDGCGEDHVFLLPTGFDSSIYEEVDIVFYAKYEKSELTLTWVKLSGILMKH